MPAGQTGSSQNLGVGKAALPHLDPPAYGLDVDLAAVEGVGVGAGFAPIGHVGERARR